MIRSSPGKEYNWERNLITGGSTLYKRDGMEGGRGGQYVKILKKLQHTFFSPIFYYFDLYY